jgi:hypothetical protein
LIFYTLQGPNHHLEIHDDKLRLIRSGWFYRLSKEPRHIDWDLETLAHFEITIPQYILWGKLEWRNFDGAQGSFRFSTDAAMVKKIEKYLQKLIIRNHQKVLSFNAASKKQKPASFAA